MDKILDLNFKKRITFFSFSDIKVVNTYIRNKKEKSKIKVYEKINDFYKIKNTNNCFYDFNKKYDFIINETAQNIECFLLNKCLRSNIVSDICNKIVRELI